MRVIGPGEKKKPAQKEIFAAVKKTAGPCSTTLVAVLQSLHISHQGHHSGSFVGNQIDKMPVFILNRNFMEEETNAEANSALA